MGHPPRQSDFSEMDHDEMAAESVHQAAQSPACELDDVPVKSVQVQLLTHEEASQADKKILSTSATQTESQDISAASLSSASLKQSSPFAFVRGQLHSCQQCTYVTLDKSAMNIHLQNHNSKPFFECHLCPGAFTRNSEFELHVLTHKQWRPSFSGHCNADFSQKSTLSDHMLTHTGKRPFHCRPLQCIYL
uniref:C2H2-type domain-containing protein n=1 Tax=Rhipicephalus microplus TaxID=6941 RepID=A0A6G5ADU6_RHIMP